MMLNAVIIQQPIWLDVNANYAVDSNKTVLVDLEALSGQLLNLFSTLIGEADWEPEFGTVVKALLFEPIDDITGSELKTSCWAAINRWLWERISVNIADIDVIPYPQERFFHVMLTNIVVKGLNKSFSVGFELPWGNIYK